MLSGIRQTPDIIKELEFALSVPLIQDFVLQMIVTRTAQKNSEGFEEYGIFSWLVEEKFFDRLALCLDPNSKSSSPDAILLSAKVTNRLLSLCSQKQIDGNMLANHLLK
jgi:hypothetical protein